MNFEDLIKAKIPAYLAIKKEELKQLRGFLREENWDEIKMLGHKIKGSAPTFGFHLLGEIGNKLEMASQEKSTETVAVLLDEFENFLKATKPD